MNALFRSLVGIIVVVVFCSALMIFKAHGTALSASAEPDDIVLPDVKPVPLLQVMPLPYEQASIQRDGKELTRYHFGTGLRRPFLFPVMGPSGRSLTRMGHPHDPVGHSHHNSVWITHNDVNGQIFWSDRGTGQIRHQRILRYVDGTKEAAILTLNAWVGKDEHLLDELRQMTVESLDRGEWLLYLDLQLEAKKKPVTLGKTAFGLIGVRMAKTIGVHDGGGMIRNSAGQVNEKGPKGVFRKRAKWVDYSGPITTEAVEGITLMDHPGNPNHPSHFHVRADGWMGASLTYGKAITIEEGKPLRLAYGLYVHRGAPTLEALDKVWERFRQRKLEPLSRKP